MISVVLDRIVDDETAVLLLEHQKGQLHCSVDMLPQDCQPGSWLLVELEDGQVVSAQLDKDKTNTVAARIKSKMELLRKRHN